MVQKLKLNFHQHLITKPINYSKPWSGSILPIDQWSEPHRHHLWVLRWSSNGFNLFGLTGLNRKLPHNWLVSFSIDLVTFVMFGAQNNLNAHHLAKLQLSISCSLPIVPLHHPNPPSLYEWLWKTLKWWAINLSMHSRIVYWMLLNCYSCIV